MNQRLFALRFTAALMVTCVTGLASSATETNRFGFAGKEIFPIDNDISHLTAADIDGDGLQDMVVANNSRSKISILYNQTGKTNANPRLRTGRREINELPPDARFRIDAIASEKRITSLVVTDLNNDKRPDIAYYGEPKELVLQYNQGTNGWGVPKRWSITDGVVNQNALTFGDINGDGFTDLVLLAESHVYVLAQDKNGALGEPEKVPYSGTVLAVQVRDVQGDGRDDLLLVNWDSTNPFRIRLQDSSGQLGPELHFVLPPIRSYWADDLDGDNKTEVITIALKSGRAQIYNFAQKASETLSGDRRQGQFHVLPLAKSSKARRGTTWADVNGDKLPDLLIAEPDSGQLTVYLQEKNGTLGSAKKFSTFTGITEIIVGDWDGDNTADIFLLSLDERQIGVTQFDANGRIAFPKSLPIDGKPLAMAVGALDEAGGVQLVCIVDNDGKRELQIRQSNGNLRRQKLSDSFKSNPAVLAVHDVTQDGFPDVLALVPYEKMKILRQVSGRDFEELDVAPPGGTVEQPWLATADVDGDGKQELLLAQKNFVRAVVLKPGAKGDDAAARSTWMFEVKEQINGASSNSRIMGAAAIPNGDGAAPSIFLMDAERKALTLCERDKSGAWQVIRNIPLPVSEFVALQPTALGDSKPNTVAMLGGNLVGWMRFTGDVWDFTELDGYESPIKEGHLHDLVSGDLNQDGRKDLVFMETGKNHIDIVTFEQPHKLVPANRWQVFQERTFRSRRTDLPEPREALVQDFNGDGKNDLAVLVHDRIIVYPQE